VIGARPADGGTMEVVANALLAQTRAVFALILHEIRVRGSQSRFDFLLVLAEPAGQMTIMMVIFTAMRRAPDFGTSLMLFMGTGIIPYFLFTHVSARTMGAVRNVLIIRSTPLIQPLDMFVARAIIEVLTMTIVAALFLTFLAGTGVKGAYPLYPLKAFEAFAATILLGVGVGLVNGVIGGLFRTYSVIYGVLVRSLIFMSAVFYVPDFLVPQIRDVISWNPLIHGVQWFRTGFYFNYPTLVLDRSYLLEWGAGTLLLGLILERIFRKKLMP
jgi:capsular polysaccharide transport system permease protein